MLTNIIGLAGFRAVVNLKVFRQVALELTSLLSSRFGFVAKLEKILVRNCRKSTHAEPSSV